MLNPRETHIFQIFQYAKSAEGNTHKFLNPKGKFILYSWWYKKVDLWVFQKLSKYVIKLQSTIFGWTIGFGHLLGSPSLVIHGKLGILLGDVITFSLSLFTFMLVGLDHEAMLFIVFLLSFLHNHLCFYDSFPNMILV